MAVGLINKEDIYNIADAIRVKLETTDTYFPSEMAEAILSIKTGGGGITPVQGSLSYTGIIKNINITPISGEIGE